MRYQVAYSIGTFEAAQWDAIAGTDIGLSHRWQRVMEAGRRDYRPLYVLVEDDRGPLAAIVANRADRFGRRGWRETLLRRLTLVVSAPFSARQGGVALRRGVVLENALPELERIFDAICLREGRLVVGVGNISDADLPAWHGQGYAASAQAPDMVLDLPVDTYDAYVAGLPKKDRSELRRVRRRGEEMGVTFALGSPGDQPEQLHALLGEVFTRHGATADTMPFTAELFPALEREMGAQAIVFLGYVNGRLAGFFLCLKQGETLLWPAAGLRYELAHPSGLYFLLIDEAVRWAIANGYRLIHGGMTNEQQKGRHGFRPRARWFCYRASPHVLNRSLRLAAGPAWRLLGRPAEIGA
ncbi:MAG: GNAT family N-acetyltransferase, partial [Chloroflexota bacterium]